MLELLTVVYIIGMLFGAVGKNGETVAVMEHHMAETGFKTGFKAEGYSDTKELEQQISFIQEELCGYIEMQSMAFDAKEQEIKSKINNTKSRGEKIIEQHEEKNIEENTEEKMKENMEENMIENEETKMKKKINVEKVEINIPSISIK